MKKLELLVILLVMWFAGFLANNSGTVPVQVTAQSLTPQKLFVFLYSPGPKWIAGKSVFEQPLESHQAYMVRLVKDKTLITGGPFTDNSGAMGIIQADNLDRARQLIELDPAVRDQVVTARVVPWTPAVSGCVGNH